MKISTMALFFGASLVMSSAGIGLAACGGDDSTGNPSSGTDSGSNHDSTTGSEGGGGNEGGGNVDAGGGDASTGSDSAAGSDCGSTPTLHESDGGPGSIYCPFGPDDGGAPIHCDPTQNQLCCVNPQVNGTFPPSTCGTACPYSDAGAATTMQCQDSITCSGNNKGSVCCAKGTAPVIKPGCGFYNESPGLNFSTCEATACASGEFQLCGQAADCPTGKTCTPFKVKGMQLGFCSP